MDISDISFGEALARMIQTKPEELQESLGADMLQKRTEHRERVAARRKEIEDGGRPSGGRFRL